MVKERVFSMIHERPLFFHCGPIDQQPVKVFTSINGRHSNIFLKFREPKDHIYFFCQFLFFYSIVIFLFYCRYRCVQESSEDAEPLEQAIVPASVALLGVSKWVTTPRLLYLHYYFNCMFSLVQETAQHYFA